MNKVVIYGGNHHNGLGLARSFGVNNIPVDAVVVEENISKSFLEKSRYVNEVAVFSNYSKALNYIKEKYHIESEKEKVFIIPYSDAAAEELDSRLDEFKNSFFCPSINNIQGEIVKLMSKENQAIYSKNCNIMMAETKVISLVENIQINELQVPCIFKPVVSAEGDKKDITICKTYNEVDKALSVFRKKKYERILYQEYLSIDYEIDVFGSILKRKNYNCVVPTRTLRSWPSNGGTNSFSRIIVDENIIEKCKVVIDALKKYGFYGLYDIELFVVGENIYLNEMNLRNSGDVYMALSQNYHYAVAWYFDVLNIDCRILEYPEKNDFCMTECADLRHVVFGKYSFFRWINDYRKCKDYALRFHGDMRPAYNRYLYYFIKAFKH